MIKSIKVTNYLGDSIKLVLREPRQTGFLVTSVTGLGPAKATINTTNISTNDGSLYNSARMSQRNIVLNLTFVESYDGESIEDIRQKSYKFFPTKKKVELVIETDNRKVKTTGYVEYNDPNIFSKAESTQISIICPDPYFYRADGYEKDVTDFYMVEPSFEFPFSNESVIEPLITFGEIQAMTEGVVIYKGDGEVGITIRIHAVGGADNVSIYDIRTMKRMLIDTTKLAALTGKGITGGDEIVINTSKGAKSITLIRDGKEYNILNCLGRNAHWFVLTKGDNLFAFDAEDGISNLQFSIENEVIYEGV